MPVVLIVLVAQLSSLQQASGISSTSQVAWSGKPVVAVASWPDGVLALVNDSRRMEGWNPWFSEWPNDVNWYEFKIHSTDDVNQLIGKLAAIKATNVLVRLNPGKQAAALAFSTVLPEKKRIAAMFSVGEQQRINEWYQRLPESEPGVRKFGVARYKEVPVASPPTLTLYAGHEAIDLEKLVVPASVQVVSDVRPNEKSPENITKAIEAFVAKHKARASAATPKPPSSSTGRENCQKVFESIKVGMTRSEVAASFQLDGGLQGVSPVRFLHPDCPNFKVDVEFDFQRDAADQNRAVIGKNDKVVRVSKPYQQQPFFD